MNYHAVDLNTMLKKKGFLIFIFLIILLLQRISVTLHSGCQMWRGGSPAPMMQIHLAAVGVICSAEQNLVNSEQFFRFIQEKTGLAQER